MFYCADIVLAGLREALQLCVWDGVVDVLSWRNGYPYCCLLLSRFVVAEFD